MANPEELCPTCHSKISQSGVRVKDGESSGIPAWSGDPILTPDQSPLNGTTYRGTQFITERDILELQADRASWEASLGITPPTEFSDVALIGTQGLEAHIVELRMSTERILEELDATLSEYFSIDADGDTQLPGPSDVAKDEWTDVARGVGFKTMGLNSSLVSLDGSEFIVSDDVGLRPTPCLPNGTYIRGIHIEDLRHPFNGLIEEEAWVEVFSTATPVTLVSPTTCVRNHNSCFSELLIAGDIHNQYRLRGSIDCNTSTPTLVSPADVTMQVIPNTLFDGESNYIFSNLNASYNNLGGGTGQNTEAISSVRGQGAAIPPHLLLNPAFQLEVYFDYTFKGGKPSSGPIPPPVPDVPPHFHGPSGTHAISRTFEILTTFISPDFDTANNFILQCLLQVYITSFEGSYVQYMQTRAAKPGFTDVINTSVSLVTLAEPGDAFDGQSVLVVPFAPFIHMFNLASNHGFAMRSMETTLDPFESRRAFGQADPDLPPSSESINATATLSGWRIREV